MAELRLENSIVDDRFLVERCLGRGSYAEIFLAFNRTNNDEPVIIKALNTSLQGTLDADLELTLLENFQNEAIALDKVRHPNIIRRLGHGTAADLEGAPFHYLLLEYMPGGDLLAACKKRPFGINDALYYFQQVAEALDYAHSRKIIHRDMKPNNLLLSEDHRVIKIADFGVAKMTADDNSEITRVGTNVYAPPEHHPDGPTSGLGEKLTPSADIYSLAKTIYTVITGRPPRQFARRPIAELPEEIISEQWGAELLRVLAKATASLAADRYQTVQEFWEDFARLETYKRDGQEADPEATIVRSRLSGKSNVERAAAEPHFQTLAAAPHSGGRAQKAPIVVELPQQPPPYRAPETAPQSDPAIIDEAASYAGNDRRAQVPATAQGEKAANVAVSEKQPSDLKTKRVAEDEAIESSFFDDLRAVINSNWLRRIFVIFLVASLVGFVASVYFYFAERGRALPSIFSELQTKDGAIGNALNVNMRSGPAGEVLAVVPAGSRVRVYENQNGWLRIKVLEWMGGAPSGAPDGGWVDGRYVVMDP